MATKLKLIQGLSHPLRIAILDSLDRHRSSPTKLAEELDVKVSQLSYHVDVLRSLKLIRLVEVGPRQGECEQIYELVPPAFTRLLPHGKAPPALRDPAATPVLQAMVDAGVDALAAGALNTGEDSHLTYMSAALDSKGWAEVGAIVAETESRISAVKAKAAKRLSSAGERGTVTTVVVAGFKLPDRDRG
jgi:DNA-binding transcriptional ArsR family regulator